MGTNLKLCDSNASGSYLVLKLDGESEVPQDADPQKIGRALLPLLSTEGVLDEISKLEGGPSLLAGIEMASRLSELEAGVAELSGLLEAEVTVEQRYQDWCETHWWALGPVYIARDDVRDIALGDSIDLLMERTANGLRDVIELKRPNMPVINLDGSHRSYYWSSDASKAIGQCHRYLDALHEGASSGLRNHREIVAYHPRARVIIGRSHDWTDEKRRQLHGLNARLHGVSVHTYDDLLNQAEQALAVLRTKNAEHRAK